MQSKWTTYLTTFKVNQQINDHHHKKLNTKNSQLETSKQKAKQDNGWNLPNAEIVTTIGNEMIVNQKGKEEKTIIYYAVYGIQNSEDCTVQNLIILKQRNHMIKSMWSENRIKY